MTYMIAWLYGIHCIPEVDISLYVCISQIMCESQQSRHTTHTDITNDSECTIIIYHGVIEYIHMYITWYIHNADMTDNNIIIHLMNMMYIMFTHIK